MADFDALRTYLEEHRIELLQTVNDPEFEQGFANLEETWQQQAEDPDLLQMITERQMRQYPSMWQRLLAAGLVQDEQPAIATVADAADDSRSLASTAPVEEAHPPQPEARPGLQGAPSEHVTAGPEKRRLAMTRTGGNRPMNTPQPDSDPSTPERTTSWEKRIAIGKELITGMMGVAIVAVTLVIAFIAILSVNNATTYAAAKDVLLYLNGLVGVVLGYYFGRAPGDMRADKATSDAKTARTQLDRTVSEVRTILDTNVSFDRDGDVTLTRAQVEQLRRILRDY